MERFTVKQIQNLKPQDAEYLKSEGDGLYIRVSPKGKKTWLYIYQFEGKRRWYKLGTFPDKSLSEARDLRSQASTKVGQGIDVAEEDRLQIEESRQSPTVTQLAELYIERHAKKQKRTWKEDERNLQKDVLPKWGKRKAKDIRRSDVITLLDEIIERQEAMGKTGNFAQPRHVFAVVRKMFNFALERDLVEFNPCAGVKSSPPPEPRKRHLNEEEIKQFWTNLDDCGMSDEIRRALRLTLVTGQRPGEIIGIRWEEIEGNWWTLPWERSKNKRPHRVYLTNLALSILGNASDGPVFPSPRNPKKPIESPKIIKKSIGNNAVPQAVRKNLSLLGLEDFKPHDLRGTVTTQMSKMGIEKYIRERVQNHIDPSVSAKHYDAYDYDAEKEAALERWSHRLKTIIEGKPEEKVLDFPRVPK